METPRFKLLGMSAKALVITCASGIAMMLLFGFWIGLLAVVIVSGVVQYRNYREGRPEAAYELTENGVRQLWNEGPKILVSPWRSKSSHTSPNRQ